MTEVTDERWTQHSTILTLKGECAKLEAEARALRNAGIDLLHRAEAAEKESNEFRRALDKGSPPTIEAQSEINHWRARAEAAEKLRDEAIQERDEVWEDKEFQQARADRLAVVLERIANESMDYQYVARAALEDKP